MTQLEQDRAIQEIPSWFPSRLSGLQRFVTGRNVLFAMMGLQVLWLAVIWLTGATERTDKLLVLAIYTLMVGTAVIYLPTPLVLYLNQAGHYFKQHPKTAVFLLCALVFGIGLIYATQQRTWTFDEEGNFRAAQVVAEQGPAALFENYDKRPWLGKQHPPLIPLLHGLVLWIFGPHQVVARLVTLTFALGVGVLAYKIGRDLYDIKTGLLAVLFLFTFPLIFRLGTAAMVEVPLTFFFALTLFLTIRLVRQPTPWLTILVGLCVGAGLLSKYTMVFVIPIIFSYFVIHGSVRRAARLFAILAVIGGIFLAAWLLFASNTNVLQQQFSTLLHYAGLVLTNPYGRKVLFETLTNRLPSSLGVYSLPAMALGAIFLFQRHEKPDQMVLLWIILVWLPLMLTLPDHRYFMPSFPAVAILMAVGIQRLPQIINKAALLAVLYGGGSLYLFIDWVRASELFVK